MKMKSKLVGKIGSLQVKFWRQRPIKEVMLLDTADKGREKAIESYYSIKKRLRGNDDDKSEMLLTTYVKKRLTKFYSKLHSRFPGQFNQGGL